MILRIGDMEITGSIQCHSRRSIKRSGRGWTAITPETRRAIAGHGGDQAGCVNRADAVVEHVCYKRGSVGANCDSLREIKLLVQPDLVLSVRKIQLCRWTFP